MTYALQVFCAVYNYRFLDARTEEPAVVCKYGEFPAEEAAKSLHIPAKYRASTRGHRTDAAANANYRGEDLLLFHGIEESSGRPDWLGEIFEWLTATYELGCVERDSVGRIPYSASVFAKEKLSPRKPYASVLMAWLQNEILKRDGGPTAAVPPVSPDADHLVISSHDVDFYWVRRIQAITRLTKNLGIAAQYSQGPRHIRDTSRMLRDVIAGRRAGDYVPALVHAAEHWNFRSTLFVVARHGHRRDPDYRLCDIRTKLLEARDAGFDVELHGSYTSAIESASLASEANELAASMGNRTRGGRQHWLRFDSHQKLFRSVAAAGLFHDSTLGFPETVGFRNGASFAFPPYDFETEKAFDFLEIPLVLMDGALEAEARATREEPTAIANAVLGESRRWGWGGVAVLWHNPIEALSVPAAINDVFWRCVAQQERHREKWISASDFLARSLGRYQNAGLLQGVQLDA